MKNEAQLRIATYLRHRRFAQGIAQRDIAVRMGRRQSTVSDLESLEIPSRFQMLQLYAEAQDLDLHMALFDQAGVLVYCTIDPLPEEAEPFVRGPKFSEQGDLRRMRKSQRVRRPRGDAPAAASHTEEEV
jgi:transcriptional regulator with XRE-family HTH domain